MAGVPIAVSTSWFLITVVMVAIFAPRIHGWLHGVSYTVAVLVALGYTLILALSVLAHELGHAFSAKAFRWTGSTIEITLWGGHTTFNEVNSTPLRSLAVSVAGPAVNLALGAAALVWLTLGHPAGVTGALLAMTAWGNLLLGAFNLLPGLPLDGGRFVESLAWKITGSRASGVIAAGWAGRIVTVLGGAWLVADFLRAPSALPYLQIVIAVAVLLPLWSGASASISYGRLRRRVETLDLGAVTCPVTLLESDASVADAEAAGVLDGTVVMSTVADRDGRQHRLWILPEAVAAVPAQERRGTPATRTGVVGDDADQLPQDATAEEIVDAVVASAAGAALLMDPHGRAVGAVRRDKLIAALERDDPKNSRTRRT